MRSAQKIIAPVRMGMMVISPLPLDGEWSEVIWRASSRTRSAMRDWGMRTRSMSPCIDTIVPAGNAGVPTDRTPDWTFWRGDGLTYIGRDVQSKGAGPPVALLPARVRAPAHDGPGSDRL